MITDLSNLTLDQFNSIMESSGYGPDGIHRIEYVNTRNGQIRYRIFFTDVEDHEDTGYVYISISDSGKLTAEY